VERIEAYYKDYEAGCLDFNAYEEFLLAPLISIPPKTRTALKRAYLEQVEATIRGWMVRRVAWHRDQGHALLLITAANHFLAEAIAKRLQFRNILCTRAEIVRGKFTGKLQGTPAFRTGKVALLNEWLGGRGLTLAGSWGYSDSFNDLPLLNIVEHPVAVSPDARLRSHAAEMNWQVLDGDWQVQGTSSVNHHNCKPGNPA
jgi:HAD superfamily hydrolase (TIGR01490 family)